MSDKCPICEQTLIDDHGHYPPKTGDRRYFDCPRCGAYILSRSLAQDLSSILKGDNEKIAILSHSIRKMHRRNEWPYIDSYLITDILKISLPNPFEQIDNFVLWLGENASSGESKEVDVYTHQSIFGAKTIDSVRLILNHLFDSRIIDGYKHASNDGLILVDVYLTIKGWQYFNEINKGSAVKRRAFIAMKFGYAELNWMLENCFKPAVAATGFELYKLDDIPKAGLIDDRLRVEIRTSRFLISDLSHENAGAYWEAGYAEGLGKPVIYLCEKSKFESNKTHFDTNHHLTVIWDKTQPDEAASQLKSIIRATMPDEAKLFDD